MSFYERMNEKECKQEHEDRRRVSMKECFIKNEVDDHEEVSFFERVIKTGGVVGEEGRFF